MANHVRIRAAAYIIGQQVTYSQGTEWGRLHCRDLERESIQALKYWKTSSFGYRKMLLYQLEAECLA